MYCNDLEVIIMYAAINEIKNNKRMGAWGNYIHFNFLLRKKRGCRTKKLVRSPVSMKKITAGLQKVRLFV